MSIDYPRKQTQVDIRFRPHPFPRAPKEKPPPPEYLGEATPFDAPPGDVAAVEMPEMPEIMRSRPAARAEPGEEW